MNSRLLSLALVGALTSCSGGTSGTLPTTNAQVKTPLPPGPTSLRSPERYPKAGPYLFVLSASNDKGYVLSTIDETTNTVVHKASLGACDLTSFGPIALTHNRKHLYIEQGPAYPSSGAVLIYDPFRDRVTKSIPLTLAELGEMTLTHDGRHLYLANIRLTDINALTNKVTVTLPLMPGLGQTKALLVSNVSDDAYATIEGITTNYEFVYNPGSRALAQYTLPSESFAQSAALTPDGSTLYFSVFPNLYAIATSTMTPTTSAPLGPFYSLAISSNGGKLFGVHYFEAGIEEYALPSLQPGASLPGLSGTTFVGTVFNDNGTRLYTALGSEIYVVDPDNMRVVKVIPLHSGEVSALVSQ